MFDYDVKQDPYFTYLPSNWPSDKTIALFLFLYYDAKKLDKSFLTDKINEIKQFALVSHVTWALWSLSMGETNIQFGYLEFAQARIDAFQRLVNSKSKSRRASTNGWERALYFKSSHLELSINCVVHLTVKFYAYWKQAFVNCTSDWTNVYEMNSKLIDMLDFRILYTFNPWIVPW